MHVCGCAVGGQVLLLARTVDTSCVLTYLVCVTSWLGCFSGGGGGGNALHILFLENLSYYICMHLFICHVFRLHVTLLNFVCSLKADFSVIDNKDSVFWA